MNFKHTVTWPRYTWCPEDPEGVDHYRIGQYLTEKMGPEWGMRWLHELDRLVGRTKTLNVDSVGRLLQQICQCDSAEMVELMYPIMPDLFLTPLDYPYRNGKLNAVARCAQMGSVACLETLLELGADPNGLDCVTGMNQLWLVGVRQSKYWPVTPLDCARKEGYEDCCLLLEMYGGQTAQELCGLERDEMPLYYRVLVLGEELEEEFWEELKKEEIWKEFGEG